jgi:HAD superfamily hydrolase (TIGR01509 family)
VTEGSAGGGAVSAGRGPRARAVVFDLDGVLWDGEPLYHRAFNILLEPLGFRISDEEYSRIIGFGVEDAWAWVLERFQLKEDPARFLRDYNRTVLELLESPVEPIAGVRELIERLRSGGVPVGLASASLRRWVDATLRGLRMEGCFDATVSASEVKRSKPAPDLYLLAAEKLGVPPAECLAVEDTRSGIQAAKAAGMFAVQVRAASTALDPLPEADAVIDDYSQFDMRWLGMDTANRGELP